MGTEMLVSPGWECCASQSMWENRSSAGAGAKMGRDQDSPDLWPGK